MSSDDSNWIPPRMRPPQSPSRRRPNKSWRSNEADRIERLMQHDHHYTWGYVIYRTTYSSDDDWAKFLGMLRAAMEKTFERCNGRDILDLFTLTTFSDPTLFDNASTPAIRAHFQQWAQNAFKTEQQSRPPPLDCSRNNEAECQVRMSKSPRYQFCIQVDEAALHSVVHEAPAAPDVWKKGWVKLISKSWLPWDEDPLAHGRQRDPNTYEPIEGVTEYDVGWMKVPYRSVMTEYYSGEEGLNGWRTEYCRPPRVVGPPYDE